MDADVETAITVAAIGRIIASGSIIAAIAFAMSAPVITPFVPPALIPTIIVVPVITAIAAIAIPPPVIVASIIVVAIAPAIIVTAPFPLVVIAQVIVIACLAPLFAAVPTAAWRYLWARLTIPAAAPVVIIIALVIFAASAALALACLRILSVGLTLPSRPAVFAAFAAFILGRILRRCWSYRHGPSSHELRESARARWQGWSAKLSSSQIPSSRRLYAIA